MKATAQEEKILIKDDSHRAQEDITKATEMLPVVNELLAKYKALGFERQIESAEDVSDLLHRFDKFIETERLKSVPNEIAGMKINRLDFLNKMVAEPEELAELRSYAKTVTYNSIWFHLYIFDANKKEFKLCTKSCSSYKEDHKQYARGRQVKALKTAEKLVEIYAELSSYGIKPEDVIEKYDLSGYSDVVNGHIPRWRIKDKGFVFRIPAEDPAAVN